MGVLRLLLAFAVVLNHAPVGGGLFLPDGATSVQCFYMISGFYIQSILAGPYRGRPLAFFANRLLRLWPMYAGALVLTAWVWWMCIPGRFFSTIYAPGELGLYLWFSQLSLVGQDWALFMGSGFTGSLWFTPDFNTLPLMIKDMMFLPQAWSIGLELYFYALAPCLLRLRSRWLLLVIFSAIGARLIVWQFLGWVGDPWSYRFFPFEIATFLAGSVAQRASTMLSHSEPNSRYHVGAVVLVFFAVCTLSLLLPGGSLRTCLVLGSVGVGLPSLDRMTRHLRWDRSIGEWSYPIYVTHMIPVHTLYATGLFWTHPLEGLAYTIVATVALSWMLLASIGHPIERLRVVVRNVR